MKLRPGLHAQFLLMMGGGLLVVAALIALLLHRQGTMQDEVEHISRVAMSEMAGDSLQRRGEGTVVQLADSLANPMYYFDLDAIGALVKAALRQSDTRYVLVFDANGEILHDGTDEIRGYGRPMTDPLAYEAIKARRIHTQFNDELMDVAMPVMIGSERVGGVRVGYDLGAIQATREGAIGDLRTRLDDLGRRNVTWLAVFGAGLLLLGLGVSWLVRRSLVQPIRALADAAREIELGQLEPGDGGDRRLPSSARADELGDLVRAFGRMRDSVVRHDRDIRRMAYTDALTGLANRLAFREALDQHLLCLHGAGRELALLFADIDDFKRINDTLGHDVGDEVLLQFAQRIRRVVDRLGGGEAMLARFGGDEFVILVESDAGTGHEGDARAVATRLAEALVTALGAPLSLQGRQVFLGTSIGISLFPDDASSATALMKNGDIAMYQAKVAGKNCYRFYSRAMDQAVERRVHMEQELRGAWARGELSLAYQPIHRLSDGRLVGAEALLRWQHPELGQVAPSVFIDVAEQSGLIETIGPRVLHAACRDAVHWQRARPGEPPLFVSVNVSPRQLRSGDLPQVVATSLADSGLDPQHLHVELTETAVIGDEILAGKLLSRLRETGVKVWLDDFGTGFSGLSHLRRVPVDGVKIDRSFVADILRDPDDLALTTAIIAMAHSLGITVVAEGVEKEGQYGLLRERGCDQAQGYWLGQPMALEAFMAQLRDDRPLPEPAPRTVLDKMLDRG
ncbi:putative bifunctional diguanylate cyclase/phosphodiesterase [Novilysobacter arseniciresistens]|uniref:putative bifunctional diguanylate cyclase/phosphodiesterase n=1 Tax=Novilysobacter arseniciresistens TaxID=1385522 RepID=UPI00068F0B14|nr:EAL domain-containing protein [Lysobacter arseniciresistens]